MSWCHEFIWTLHDSARAMWQPCMMLHEIFARKSFNIWMTPHKYCARLHEALTTLCKACASALQYRVKPSQKHCTISPLVYETGMASGSLSLFIWISMMPGPSPEASPRGTPLCCKWRQNSRKCKIGTLMRAREASKWNRTSKWQTSLLIIFAGLGFEVWEAIPARSPAAAVTSAAAITSAAATSAAKVPSVCPAPTDDITATTNLLSCSYWDYTSFRGNQLTSVILLSGSSQQLWLFPLNLFLLRDSNCSQQFFSVMIESLLLNDAFFNVSVICCISLLNCVTFNKLIICYWTFGSFFIPYYFL